MIEYPYGVGDIVTRVLECGERGPELVMIHGVGARADRWRTVMPLLASAGYHVFAPDLPGHGFASKEHDFPYGSPAFAAFTNELISSLGLRTPVLVGTSLGGHVAALAALTGAAPPPALVLIGASGIVTVDRQTISDTARALVLTDTGVREKLRFVVADPDLVTDEWVREELRINTSPGAREAASDVEHYVRTQLNDDVVGSALAASGIPTLVLWGERDQWMPLDVGLRVHEALPKAEWHIIENVGHAPFFERPDLFAKRAVEFLAEKCPV